MSDGIRSGVNWMRRKPRSRICGQRADEQRLGEAGHAGQQAVPAGEEGREHEIDGGFLAHDHLAQFGQDAVPAVGYPSHQRAPLVGGEGLRLLLRDVVHSFLAFGSHVQGQARHVTALRWASGLGARPRVRCALSREPGPQCVSV